MGGAGYRAPMTQIKHIKPTIYHPNWLKAAHAKVSPNIQAAAQVKLAQQFDATTPAHIVPSWLTARRQAHEVCGTLFNATDVVLGDSSKRHGLTGRAAHSIAYLGATVLSAPAWLCFDLHLSTSVLHRMRHLLLGPLTPVCLLSACVGLLFKSAAFVLLYPAVLMGSFLVHVVQAPQKSPAFSKSMPAPQGISLEDVSHLRAKHQTA